jgi:signal transduction histidine kinase
MILLLSRVILILIILNVIQYRNRRFIDVWDRGKGISEPHHKLIFERLFTLVDSRNHSYQGSGLGLAITKRLVELIDGKIQLHSSPYEKLFLRSS